MKGVQREDEPRRGNTERELWLRSDGRGYYKTEKEKEGSMMNSE